MLYTNLGFANDKTSCCVMHKHIIINCETFANEFDIDPSLQNLSARFFPNYSRNQAIYMLFPYSNPKDASRKLLITNLSFKDKILDYAIYKMILPKNHQFYSNSGG